MFSLIANEVLIGRRSDADIILADPYVSRHHAKLVKTDQFYKIVDLGSSHGTYLNGLRIDEQQLQSGDRISLGRNRVELLFSSGEGETTTLATIEQPGDHMEETK